MQFIMKSAAGKLKRRADAFGMSAAMVDASCGRGFQAVARAEFWCESPIEKRLLPWLVFEDYGDEVTTIPAIVHSPKNEASMPPGDVVIVPQFGFAKVRMDFAVVVRVKGVVRIVCVECDGRDTHVEDYDTARDEYLAAWGIPTVRATGTQIYRSAEIVSLRVGAIVQSFFEAG